MSFYAFPRPLSMRGFGFSMRFLHTSRMKLDSEKLIECRGLAGLSQRELAERVSVSTSQIWRYENGAAQPRRTTLYRLAHALNVTTQDLCKEGGKCPIP